MKKLLLLLLVLSVFASYAQVPSYVPTNGLVGYWPFNGNANDASGNGNNGVVNGATLTTDRFGNQNSAYQFDYSGKNFGALNKEIYIPYNSSFNSSKISVSAWVKPRQYYWTGDSNTPFTSFITRFQDGYSNPNGQVWGMRYNSSSSSCFLLQAAPNNNQIATGVSLNEQLALNSWTHLVFTWDGSTVKYYRNGVLVSSTSSNLFLNTIGNSGISIGVSRQANGFWFDADADIDDIEIYNRDLIQQEITQLYTRTSANCIANIINNDTTICKGQSLTLNADAVASGSVTDINGNVYPTVNIGSQTWMQKNLNVSKYKNGDVIPQVTNYSQWLNLSTGAWCWYNNDSATYASTYGKLYNWYAVNDPRGLEIEGWNIPTVSDFKKLIKFVDNQSDSLCNNCVPSLLAGGSLKEIGTSHWLSPNIGATDSFNFKGIGAGYCNSDPFNSQFLDIYKTQFLWSKNLYDVSNAFALDFGYSYTYSALYKHNLKYGFSVRCFKNNNSTYLWSTGATTPSITVSPLVTTTYYCTVSDGVNTCRDSVKITVGASALPTTPLAITGATDVCSYIGADTASVSLNYKCNKVSTASSYLWTVPAGVTLLSGQGDTSVNLRFSASFVSGAITVKSVNVCGVSTSARSLTVYKRVAATPAAIQKEFSPTSIVAVTNVTGLVSETYRIKKVTYATSYNWSMNRGTSATITHINPLGANDTAVIVTFANCFLRDTLSVKSVTPCSVSIAKTAILIGYTTPAAVSGITTVGGNFATCIGATKTFTAIRGTPTTSQAPITSFRWTRPANTTIVSATSDSASVTVSFNTGYTGGSMSAKGVSSCGTIGTTASTAILQFLPPGVLSIASSTGAYNACIGNSITYSALVSAPSTSQVAASVFRWTKPNNTTITSASADSSTITLQFNTGYIGGTLSVKGQTSCGTQGTTKNQSLTHAGCAAGTKMSVPVTTTTNNSFEVSLYPNPSAGEFKLLVNFVGGKTPTMAAAKATVKIIDLQGRLIKSFECNANQVIALGNELKPGVYMVEVRMGNEVKTVRAVRF